MDRYELPRPLPQVICSFLREERVRRGWTQHYVSVQYYNKFQKTLGGKLSLIENGDEKPWEPIRQGLAILFEMPEHELFPELYEYAKKVPVNGEPIRRYGSQI
jgi:transcriptional regulator with XRE-family HTH domain